MNVYDIRKEEILQMAKITVIALISVILGLATGSYAAEVTLGPDLKIPPHYKPGSGGCTPGRGYSFSAEAPNYPSTYPKLNLRVFNGEVIGFNFEVKCRLKKAGNPGTISRKESPLSMTEAFLIIARRSILKPVQQRRSVKLRKARTDS